MREQTQACRLTQMMQASKHYVHYKLTLPLLSVQNTALKKLSLGDILLLGLDTLECIVWDENKVIATMVLVSKENKTIFEVITIGNIPEIAKQSKKYEVIQISLGKIKKKSLSIGDKIDVETLNIEQVHITHDNKSIAEGSLINMQSQIAVKIDKVL